MNKSQNLIMICEKAVPNSYIGVKLEDGQWVIDHLRSIGIRNHLPVDELHSTVVYSKVPISDTSPINQKYSAKIIGYDLFGKNKDTLVALLESDTLTMSNYISRGRGAKPTFDDYKPHLTLINNEGTESDLANIRANPLPSRPLVFSGHME